MTYYSTKLDSIFQALADPTRRAVLAQLSSGPASVTDLSQDFDMALPSFMGHLKKLEDGGLITSKKHGRVRTLCLAACSAGTGARLVGTTERPVAGPAGRVCNNPCKR